MSNSTDPRPLQPIRRFDVFAETKRLEALAHGEPEDVAKGYGVRIAKIVASRRFGGAAKTHYEKGKKPPREDEPENRFRGEGHAKFRALDGELQTDETFDHDIVNRMGPEFYDVVFSPAIQSAISDGRKYEQFRDTIRKEWKPARG